MKISYGGMELGKDDQGDENTTDVFTDMKVLDATLHPPDAPPETCNGSAAPTKHSKGPALEDMPHNMQVAIAIQSAGFKCQRVTDL